MTLALEGKLKRQVKEYLTTRGAYYLMPAGSPYGKPGLDFVGCYKGRFFAIETKAPGKAITKRQELTAEKMRAAGGVVFWGDNWHDLGVGLWQFFRSVDATHVG